jgi:hypothetical protein
MSEPVSYSTETRNPLVRFFRWLFSWRGLRRVLIIMAWAATIIALLYGIENWRGRRAWKKHEQQLLARGEQLDFKAFFPKPVPDDQNFAATPFVASWSIKGNDDSSIWRDAYARVSGKIASRQNTPTRNLVDLVAWQMALDALSSNTLGEAGNIRSEKRDPASRRAAALIILESMKEIEPKIAEMRAASARPYARYPVEFKEDPWSILLPHLSKLKGSCQRLQLTASAKLAAGQSASAMDDVKLMLYLGDSLKDEPFVISYLVRVACREIAIQVIWEGLAQHAWSEAQLRDLETRLDERRFLEHLKRPLSAEHAAGIMTPDLIRKFGINYLLGLSDSFEYGLSRPLTRFVGHVIPNGWLYQEKLNYSRLLHMQQRPLFSESGAAKPRISPTEVRAANKEMEQALAYKFQFTPALNHTFFARLLLPALGNISAKAAIAQTSTDHAALACALERYRLANGHFPEQLSALVPQFIAQLPNDLVTGDPYKYRRTDDGLFILYSVGWDEKDDGGTPGERLHDQKQGDWIWDYPQRKEHASSNRKEPAL